MSFFLSNNQIENYFSQNNRNNNKEIRFNVLNASETEILNPNKKENNLNSYINIKIKY